MAKTSALLLCLVSSLCLLPSVTPVPAGAAAGMDIDLIRNIKNYVIPDIINEINSLVLPRIDYKGGYVEGITFKLQLQSLDSIAFSFDPVQNAIVLKCANINGQVKGNFR